MWGESPPELVLIHGGGQNAHTWDTVALALDRPLLAVDLPGHGHSDWPQESAWLDPSTMADDVARVVERFAPDARAVVGMSLGGATAIALATRHPHLVRRLLLVDITPGVNGDKTSDIAAFLSGAGDVRHLRRDPRSAPSSSTPPAPSPRCVAGCSTTRSSCPTARWAWRHQVGRPTVDTGLHVERADFQALWDALEAIPVPVLLARGSRSPVVDDDDVAEFRRRRPDDRVIVVEDAGHSIQGDRPLELATIIEEFVAGG